MSGRRKELREPLSNRELSTREKIILLESSKLHGDVFPPWKTAPEPAEFDLPPGASQYVDNVDLSLSTAQHEFFDGWRKPSSLRPSPDDNSDILLESQRPSDLVQDIITDCSVVASLCVIVAKSEHGRTDILESCVYPYDSNSRQPAASMNGKYIFRFHFNGCYRRVVIDDRLPSSKTSRALHVVDRNSRDIYWPALVEKAYLKVRGGYDFPGSNSGTDLWIITGWIPEQLFLQSDDLDRENLWHRVVKAFNYGDVLITLGTGQLTEREERGLGLVGEHDYAVVDAKEVNAQKLFLIKNPWSNGQIWKGQIRLHNSTQGSSMNSEIPTGQEEERLPNRGNLTPGTFWMSFNDVFQNFESIYLNWNPSLFTCRKDTHFRWDLTDCSFEDECLVSCPQFNVQCKSAGVLWLLLSRHFSTSNIVDTKEDDPGFLSLYAFHNDGQRAVFIETAFANSQYVDSPNVLLKLNLESRKAVTVAVSEQKLPRKLHSLSLSVLSFTPIELSPIGEKYVHSCVTRGAWTSTTSGGNTSSPLFHTNPQYSITFNQPSDLSLLLRNPQGWPVQVTMVWANGNQVRSLTTRDIVGCSGEYRKGFAFVELRNIATGIYTIVCSTFERHQLGAFELSIGSTTDCRLSRVIVANTGRFTTQLQDAVWFPEVGRLLAPLRASRLTRLSASAKSCGFSTTLDQIYASPLKVSIEHGRGPTARTIAVSGDDSFEDARNVGVHTTDVDILPEMSIWGLWVVLDRLGSSGSQHDEQVEVQLFSDQPVEVGAWFPEG